MNIPALLYKLYEPLLWSQIKDGPRPQHIGLIVDGNRRFARLKGMSSPNEGHNAGSQKLEDFLRWCWRLDIKIVTLYGFSTENYKRSEDEIDYLMDLILRKLRQYQVDPVIKKERVKIKVIGQRENLSEEMIREIEKTEALTEDHDRFQLNIAVSYGGRAEIVDTVKKLAELVQSGDLQPDQIDEETFSRHLYTEGIPDPDLIIRTSGEERLSGFLIWQSAYSELYFTEVYWPAFRMIDFWRAIRVFQQRERRFGK
ncbi:MAG: di-trans,poly-cis-decaprenylcistransferase [Pseudomonadales bacterium]|nr:di-trans,poly-cis-decaprenylcistransferase [Pseudomonadales bacterium]MBO6566002.1 di-trans,poly-cis-decaprenylcistransferase [Pseudomonadales bacterium]MBO6595646.1 di-trans,poly-cis-decaprenylcistransferase [Pseudomonadales bacterium]MBO6655715.1 di-trans,poly-cis-decaprenylcistransferase [Pseudomonadales bacterium]MBO6702146.1 di-trans,poly-cis-decaprenylcistransferase [Pseudomonadales bacterium]